MPVASSNFTAVTRVGRRFPFKIRDRTFKGIPDCSDSLVLAPCALVRSASCFQAGMRLPCFAMRGMLPDGNRDVNKFLRLGLYFVNSFISNWLR